MQARSYERVGDLANAERAHQKAVALSPRVGWTYAVLAGFFVRHKDTPFYHPEEAVRLYARLLEADDVHENVRTLARKKLKRLRENGMPH